MNEDDSCGPFLGTGAFVDGRQLLVTCDHVLNSWNGGYGVAIEAQQRIAKATLLKRDPDTDLALLRTDDYQPPYSLPFEEDGNIILNNIVICFEYGTTISAGKKINFSPANRLGNVTRFRDLPDLFGKAGERMLELSFPALKGASGAPIMEWRPPFRLWGIVKANIGAELMPVQIETVVDGNGKIEAKTKFYLPQALAIHVNHVRQFVMEDGV